MLTLDEAILHCQERANADCSECARDHQQLAEWLEELKILREKQTPIEVSERTVLKDMHGRPYTIRGNCPVCGSAGLLASNTDYCNVCGQKLKWDGQLNNQDLEGGMKCFIPEKYNPHPLCVGRKLLMCEDCQLRVDWEPEEIRESTKVMLIPCD